MKNFYFLMMFISGMAFAQPVLQEPTDYFLCDQNNDGWEMFSLIDKQDEILGSLNPADFEITFHQSETNAIVGDPQIPYYYVNTINPQTVYVRVEEISTLLYSITSFDLILNPMPIAYPVPSMVAGETPFDGFATFNLTSNATQLLGPQTGINIMYYHTQADAEAGANMIVDPTAYQNISNPETVWIRLQDAVSGCFTTASFELIVVEESILNIPDANFKAALVMANPELNIASFVNPNSSVTPGMFSTIDTNGDGEIQYSEAYSIIFLNVNNRDIASLEGLDGFVNLEQIYCAYNTLTSLDVSSLNSLRYLGCYDNQLTSITLTPSLESIAASNNLLTGLDLSNMTLLQSLTVTNNELVSLDFNNSPNMWTVRAGYNNLTSMTAADLGELTLLDCGFNQITDVSLTNLPRLYKVNFQNNQLTEIDLSTCAYVPFINNMDGVTDYEVELNNNLGLEYINLKNGFVNNSISMFSTSLDNLPQYICMDEDEEFDEEFSWTPEGSQISTYCDFTPGGLYNTISGTMLFDVDNDGCSISETPQSFIRMKINDGTTEGYSFTSNAGDYSFFTQAGTFTLTPETENNAFFNFSPATATVNFADNNNNTAEEEFCVSANGVHSDVEVVIAPIGVARPGFDADYAIVYRNKGNQISSGTITLAFEDDVLDLISSTPAETTSTANQLTFDYTGLAPFESRRIELTMNVNGPMEIPAVNLNDVLDFTTTITIDGTDETPNDNIFEFNQTVVGSYDPNDKVCIEGTTVGVTRIGEYLHYIINFENTGTYPAQNVVVRDLLDISKFDVESVQMMSSSHPVVIRVTGNEVECFFKNIFLPIGGHGNILLKVKTHASLPAGTTVSNQANIYFDYNFPIVTNFANTTFQSLAIGDNDFNDSVSIYPNPSKGIVNISASEPISSIAVYDIQGRLLQAQSGGDFQTTIDLSSERTGIYFLKIAAGSKTKTAKVVIE